MKKFTKLLISTFAVMCLFPGLVRSEEIVMNKDGQPVLLKDDNTWELAVASSSGKTSWGMERISEIQEGCFLYDGAFDEAPLYRINAGDSKRVHFQDAPVSCKKGPKKCQMRKGYLVEGDVVLGWYTKTNEFRCVYYGTSKGTLIAGFIPINKLKRIGDNPTPNPKTWLGTWMHYDIVITIKSASKEKLQVTGFSKYTIHPQRFDQAEILGYSSPDGNRLEVTDETMTMCNLELILRNNYLVSDSGRNCGGINAGFLGIYTKVNAQ